MKMSIYILILLLCIGIVSASNYEVYSIKFFDKDLTGEWDRISGIDEEGGDFEMSPGDDMRIEVKVENFDSSQDIRKMRYKVFVSDLDDGSDFRESSDYFEVEFLDSEDQSLDITIPESADEDDYDFELYFSVVWINNSVEDFTIKYDLVIDDDVISSSKTNDVEDLLLNLSFTCNKYFLALETFYSNNNHILSQANNLTYDAVLCETNKLEKEKADTQVLYWQGENTLCENEIDKKNSELISCQSEKVSCNTQLNTKLSDDECNNKISEAVRLAKPNFLHYTGWILLVAAILYWKFKIEPQQKEKQHEKGEFDDLT